MELLESRCRKTLTAGKFYSAPETGRQVAVGAYDGTIQFFGSKGQPLGHLKVDPNLKSLCTAPSPTGNGEQLVVLTSQEVVGYERVPP